MHYLIEKLIHAHTVEEAYQIMRDFAGNVFSILPQDYIAIIGDDIEPVKEAMHLYMHERREYGCCCYFCVHSRQAKVWLMCDKIHKRAPNKGCSSFEITERGKEHFAFLNRLEDKINNIHTVEDLLQNWQDYGNNLFDYNVLNAILKSSVNPQRLRTKTCELLQKKMKQIQLGYERQLEALQDALTDLQ